MVSVRKLSNGPGAGSVFGHVQSFPGLQSDGCAIISLFRRRVLVIPSRFAGVSMQEGQNKSSNSTSNRLWLIISLVIAVTVVAVMMVPDKEKRQKTYPAGEKRPQRRPHPQSLQRAGPDCRE